MLFSPIEEDQNDNLSNDNLNNSTHHECNFCRKVFSNPSGLRRHVKTVHEGLKQNTYKKKCPKCSKLVFQMNRHLKSCTGESPDKIYQCDFCAKSYLKISAYRLHLSKEHEDQKIQFSDFDYNSANNINEPEIKIKEEPKDSINAVKEEFQDHEEKNVHEGQNNLTENGNNGNGNTNSGDNNQFDEKINASTKNEYHELQEFQCSYCDKKCATRLDFKNHMKNIHEKLQCCQCERLVCLHFKLFTYYIFVYIFVYFSENLSLTKFFVVMSQLNMKAINVKNVLQMSNVQIVVKNMQVNKC